MIRVVGLDLSLQSTGIARATVDDDGRVRSHTEVVASDGVSGASLRSRWIRLDFIATKVAEQCERADIVLIESPTYSPTVTGSAHDRAGSWWLIVDRIAPIVPEVLEVHTSHLKIYATGKGTRVTKQAVIDAARTTWGHLFDIPLGKSANDVADAVTLAALGCAARGHELIHLSDERSRALALAKLRKD